MATSLRSSLYDALKLAPDAAADRTFEGFTVNAMQISGGATIRAEMQRLGYDDPGRLRPTDPAILDGYQAHAAALSESITSTFNSMLENQISQLPDGLSIAEARTTLQPFYDSVARYNTETLIPHTTATARQDALSVFYDQNGLTDKVPWTWTQNTDFADDCTEAATASPDTKETLVDIAGGEPPVHQNCECSLDPGDVDPADLPSPDDLWTGV